MLPEMDRATERRALRAAGYRGSKSRRNRLTKDQARDVVTVYRLELVKRLVESSPDTEADSHV
jgi:hypothetical protein